MVTQEHIDACILAIYRKRAEDSTRVSSMVWPRYVRIVLEDWARNNSRSVHSFVDRQNGAILKAASWAGPANGARGSVYELEKGGFTAYGAESWR